jgi:competence protein ComEC
MLRDRLSIILLIALLGGDAFLWHRIAAGGDGGPYAAILDIGQGDSTLVVLDSGIKILTDAGPDASVTRELEEVFVPGDRYIDLAIITHPQLDHFNGFLDVIKRYEIGAFIVNGREADDSAPGSAWRALREAIDAKHIPLITLRAGDRIRIHEETVDILSPNADLVRSGELNDTGIVQLVRGRGWRMLLTADIGFTAEDELRRQVGLRADILKVGHHGSKYSTGGAFLQSVSPRIATISVGARNRYGHPTEETMNRLRENGVQLFRTDTQGTIRIFPVDGRFMVRTER